jgi:non-canonical (house-cleaning) NTP pyrophosphatase
MFPDEQLSITTVSIESGVGDQPMSDKQTLAGAISRAEGAKLVVKEANYWIGIEGGVEDCEGGMIAFAWAVVLDGTRIGKGRTGTFFYPLRWRSMYGMVSNSGWQMMPYLVPRTRSRTWVL